MKLMRSRIVLPLLSELLVGLLPLLILWNHNLGQIKPVVVLQPLWITMLFIIFIGALWLMIVRSLGRSSILACLTLIFFFSFGHFYNVLGGKRFLGISLGFIKLFIIYGIVYLLLVILVFRIKTFPKNMFLIFDGIALVLFFINLVPIAQSELKSIHRNSTSSDTPQLAPITGTNERDIFYIVLDAYTRQDVLQKVINYDNSDFIAALKQRGFYIPDCAFSNYEGTDLTISSVLNYDQLQPLAAPSSNVGQFLEENPNRIIDNKVRNYFKQYGYLFVAGHGFLPANDITNSDIYLDYFLDNEGTDDLSQKSFLVLYFNTTLLRGLTEMYNENPARYSHLPFWLAFNIQANHELEVNTYWYYQNNYIFDSIEKIPKKPGSYLVYAHINAPHGPYVYKIDGSFQNPPGDVDLETEKKLYANAVTYLNQRVLKLIDNLLQNSDIPPIIIIQGDHGIHKLTTGLDKHKILSAYYLPGPLIEPPYSTITPVNNFRLIIKNYFDQSMDLSPDVLYVKYTNDYESVLSSCDLKP